MTRVHPTTGCWLHTGPLSTSGHPKGGEHRQACAMAHGPPPSPQHEALHSAVCTTLGRLGRSCINPAHLCWGTRAENARDRGQGATHRGGVEW